VLMRPEHLIAGAGRQRNGATTSRNALDVGNRQ